MKVETYTLEEEIVFEPKNWTELKDSFKLTKPGFFISVLYQKSRKK